MGMACAMASCSDSALVSILRTLLSCGALAVDLHAEHASLSDHESHIGMRQHICIAARSQAVLLQHRALSVNQTRTYLRDKGSSSDVGAKGQLLSGKTARQVVSPQLHSRACSLSQSRPHWGGRVRQALAASPSTGLGLAAATAQPLS